MTHSRGASTRKPWALRIQHLRQTLGLSQIAFADALKSKQTTVSKWEGGDHKPTPDAFARLAAIAPDADKLYFLKLAGIPAELVDGTDAPMLTGALLEQLRQLEALRPNCAQIVRDLSVSARHVRRVYLGRVTDLQVKKAVEADIRKRYRKTQENKERVG